MAKHYDDLDAAFVLPDVIQDENLRVLYEVLVQRMREEAAHLPMNTIQQLLIERIAFNYIVLRAKERGELGGFNNSSIQKDYNTFWLSMTSEFNRMLGKSDVAPHDRKAMLKEIQKLIVETVNTIPDPKTRSDVFEKLAVAFEGL
jgi:hypothetical protein